VARTPGTRHGQYRRVAGLFGQLDRWSEDPDGIDPDGIDPVRIDPVRIDPVRIGGVVSSESG